MKVLCVHYRTSVNTRWTVFTISKSLQDETKLQTTSVQTQCRLDSEKCIDPLSRRLSTTIYISDQEFAGDVVIMLDDSSVSTRSILNWISLCATKIVIKVNYAKTEISSSSQDTAFQQLFIIGQQITSVVSFKYLR